MKNHYDIIHAKNPFSSVLPAIRARKKGIQSKIVYDIRGLWIDFGIHSGKISPFIGDYLKKIELYCANNADSIIAISDELKNVLINRGFKKNKLKVIIGDGVEFDKIQNLKKKDIKDYLGIDGTIIGYAGAIGKSRYSQRIIEAFNYVKKITDDELYLIMIGPNYNKSYFDHILKKGK